MLPNTNPTNVHIWLKMNNLNKWTESKQRARHCPTAVGVVYMHDDSESVEDSFTIQLTDGRHHVLKQVTVKVLQVNDEKPQLTRLDQHFPV